MTTYKQYSIADAPEESKPLLHHVSKALGFVPNLYATLAESAVTLEGYVALDTLLASGTFSASERQLLAIAVSSANGCAYCTAAHSTVARQLRAPNDAIAAARGEETASDPRLDALLRRRAWRDASRQRRRTTPTKHRGTSISSTANRPGAARTPHSRAARGRRP